MAQEVKKTAAEKKLKQFQLNKVELLQVQLIHQKKENLQMQMGILYGEFNQVLVDFCKRVGQRIEDLVIDQEGRLILPEDGNVMFREV